MAKVELKAPVVAEIAEAVKDAQSVVLVDYRGLTVDQDTALRKQLRAAGVTYISTKRKGLSRSFSIFLLQFTRTVCRQISCSHGNLLTKRCEGSAIL